MNNLIYYPSFEIEDENWLKLALLYFDKVHLIIPKSGDKFLSDQLTRIQDSTPNLFKKIRPEKLEVNESSRDATFAIEDIIRCPERFSADFGISGSETIVDKWQNKETQLYELFHEKFASFFKDFCIENRLAHESNNGIKVSKELADIYMAYLAKSFGDQCDLSPVTDKRRIDIISNRTNESIDEIETIQLGLKVIDCYLPQNIDRIPLEVCIEQRNSKNFMNNLHGFHNVVNELYDAIKDQQLNEENLSLMKRYEKASSLIRNDMKNIARAGLELGAIGVGCWIAFTNPITLPIGIGIAIDSMLALDATMTIKKQWSSSMQKIRSKRFITGIEKMA